MRVLMVCEAPPSVDPAHGDGSTMISAHLLRHFPTDVDVDLVYFHGADDIPDERGVARARSVRAVRQRSRRRALLAQGVTDLPRGNWQRPLPTAELTRWASEVDVVYFHGLHVMHLGLRLESPSLVHEVDPWSQYWRQRAHESSAVGAVYDRLQARRAARLEQAVAERGSVLVVVNEADATWLRETTGGHVVALPNGVEEFEPAASELPADPVATFVGTLDYPPNIEALTRLVDEVWPLVRERIPAARLVVAGRRPGADVLRLRGHGVEVVGEVDDVSAVFRGARASIYAGLTGKGTKNSVSESVAAGCPVIASPEAARGQALGPHLLVATDPSGLATHAVRLLDDDRAATEARDACASAGAHVRSWGSVAAEMAHLLEDVAVAERLR